jgi:Alw26I/Eco31I/Esp3I family type II restriction endonuclease
MEAADRPPRLSEVTTARHHGDERRAWNDAFVNYAYAIVGHPAYEGMPCTVDEDGKVDWTIPSYRAPGTKNWDGNRRRRVWWEEKARSIGVPIEGKWISQVARRIHPWGWKPCQTCGRWMRIAYAYPTARLLTRLNAHLPATECLEVADLLDIYEVAEHLVESIGEDKAGRALQQSLPSFANAVGRDLAGLQEELEAVVRKEPRGLLSPGAMSNAPDRLDGFHTYNLCCRSRQDTGRSSDNLKTYGVDRRAIERWSEGDWEAANVLMHRVTRGPCPRCGEDRPLTADHVGPISLGFRHTPHFEAVCGSCNSAKNNRMSMRDVQHLIELEAEGIPVTSWHATPLWERARNCAQDEAGAVRLSKLMNVNQHEFLRLLLHARQMNIPDALMQFLSPQYAEEKVEFAGLNRVTLRYDSILRSARQETYIRTKAARLVRISFEALDEYARKPKRNVQVIPREDLVDVTEGVDLAVERAIDDPSTWRAPLLAALDPAEPATIRDNRLQELIGSGTYQPDHDYGYLRDAFERYVDGVAEVLAARLDDDRAIKLWDDALGGDGS